MSAGGLAFFNSSLFLIGAAAPILFLQKKSWDPDGFPCSRIYPRTSFVSAAAFLPRATTYMSTYKKKAPAQSQGLYFVRKGIYSFPFSLLTLASFIFLFRFFSPRLRSKTRCSGYAGNGIRQRFLNISLEISIYANFENFLFY